MSPTLSLYAFQPGAPGVPAGSGTGVFIGSLVNLLQGPAASEALRNGLRVHWLQPAGRRRAGLLGEWRAAAGWLSSELGRLLRDRSRDLLFVYPKLPVLAYVSQPQMIALAHQAYRALGLKSRLTRQRIWVLVEDLPIELSEGRAKTGAPRSEMPVNRIRSIERTLFTSAHRLIVPEGFADPIRKLHGVPTERLRTFRRNIYLPTVSEDRQAELDFPEGEVNFFYSGSIDTTVAPNFREVLKSIRNAPGTRLHVCGGGRDSVRQWFSELDVPNARHYGQLGVAAHDRLAQRCDIGLILYPTDNPYNHLTPTMKYSAYLANGLAVLTTDLASVTKNVQRDRVGRALPIAELSLELLRWATRPGLWADFKAHALEQSALVRSGDDMKEWIEEIGGRP